MNKIKEERTNKNKNYAFLESRKHESKSNKNKLRIKISSSFTSIDSIATLKLQRIRFRDSFTNSTFLKAINQFKVRKQRKKHRNQRQKQ